MNAATALSPHSDVTRDRRDRTVLQRVHRALAATGYPHLWSLRVGVHEGLVSLHGRVSTYYQKQLAQEVARRVDGVGALNNEILVRQETNQDCEFEGLPMSNTLTPSNRRAMPESPVETSPVRPESCGPAFNKAAVADLSLAEIREMSADELVDVIRGADVPLFRRKEIARHLCYYDWATLEQLAFLARQTCRNQGY